MLLKLFLLLFLWSWIRNLGGYWVFVSSYSSLKNIHIIYENTVEIELWLKNKRTNKNVRKVLATLMQS